MRQEIETRYGLRHIPTGRIVRVDVESNYGRGNCGDETVTLSLDARHPRFEAEHMVGIVPVLCRDENWYNTSRERPGWGKLNPDDLEVVQFMRSFQWEEGAKTGSDPTYEFRSVAKAPFPGFAKAARFRSRTLPPSLYATYFGVQMEKDDRDWTEIALLSFDEGQSPEDAVGRFVRSGRERSNAGLILAVADLPEDYPVDGLGKAMLEEGGRMHIAIVDIRNEDGPPLVLTPVEESRLAP